MGYTDVAHGPEGKQGWMEEGESLRDLRRLVLAKTPIAVPERSLLKARDPAICYCSLHESTGGWGVSSLFPKKQ
jgi:hypothetical protein